MNPHQIRKDRDAYLAEKRAQRGGQSPRSQHHTGPSSAAYRSFEDLAAALQAKGGAVEQRPTSERKVFVPNRTKPPTKRPQSPRSSEPLILNLGDPDKAFGHITDEVVIELHGRGKDHSVIATEIGDIRDLL